MKHTPVMISTAGASPAARLGFWQSQVGTLLTHLECTSDLGDDFFGSITAHLSQPASLMEISTASHAIARHRPRVSQAGEEQVFICIQAAGQAVIEQDCRQGILNPGDITLLDTSRSFNASFPAPMRQLVLQVPRALLRRQIGTVESFTASVATADSPLVRMTTDFITALSKNLDRLDTGVVQRLMDQALDMITLTFMSSLDSTQPAASRNSATRSVLAYRGRVFIEANLRDSSLSPASIAEHLGISKRYLAAVFASDGQSVERCIWERRLMKCARDLRDPSQTARPVGDIAFSWGFNSLSHFSQSFKAAFGITPREFRRRDA